ncbi:hypothetical protein Ngar_c24670 [Candidatus Nitrososphaera gargensis Ga9.2]|uniref:Uncharacterized protein n=1 Tax=Nitrososphaera gargensis (strain Ga9.2) TaxID=1237085 RepID=K0IDB6_NITGG|nr:hypothetical protein [Candidatus Nitrososphaera gargensis]AFU59391.1 hypothetical protein Ngar_c24670 [Candidatus Nitrososphaera gargensis Ga9.2]
MTTTFATDSFKVVNVSPISDQFKRLQVISCDISNVGRKSFNVLIDGIISEVTVLKRCCDKSVKSFSQ